MDTFKVNFVVRLLDGTGYLEKDSEGLRFRPFTAFDEAFPQHFLLPDLLHNQPLKDVHGEADEVGVEGN